MIADFLNATRSVCANESSSPYHLPRARRADRSGPVDRRGARRGWRRFVAHLMGDRGDETRAEGAVQVAWAPAIPIEMIDVGGHRLRFIKTGQGPSLVLLHTLRTQLDLFAKVIPELGTSRSTPWTIPGTASRTFRGRYDAAFFTAAVEGFIERLELRDITWRASRSVERSRSSSPRVAIRVSRGWSPSTPTTTPRAGAWRAARCSAGW